MRVDLLPTVPPPLVGRFYELYVAAFEPLRTLAAARHVLTFDEFADEMADARIDKYVVVDDEGTAVGLTTFTGDLTAVPWIEPAYFAARYPEHAARDAIFYLGFTLTDPAAQRGRVFATTLRPIVERMLTARGVVAYDICAHNDTVRGLGRGITRAMGAVAEIAHAAPDVQTYYALECLGPKVTPQRSLPPVPTRTPVI